MTVTARGKQMIAIVSVLVGVSMITVIMRVIARLKRRVKFGIDDYLCFFSMGLLLAMLIELVLCEYSDPTQFHITTLIVCRGDSWRQWRTHG